jgi:hypothetical protein
MEEKQNQKKESIPEIKVSRKAETILGVLGGLFGLLGAFFALLAGGLGSALEIEGASDIVGLAWLAILLSIIGIISGAAVNHNAEVSGVLMLICGIGGFIAISFGYIIAGPLLIAGGILALTKKS